MTKVYKKVQKFNLCMSTVGRDKIQGQKTRLRRVLRLGTAFAVTLPPSFVRGVEYLLIKEVDDDTLLVKKARVEEASLPPPNPLGAGRRRPLRG
jgi:hypothetical protein